MKTATLIATAALALAGPVAAQHGGGQGEQGAAGMGGGMGMMSGGMDMDMMHGGMSAMLALKGPLGLSADQTQRIEALQAAAAQEAEHHTHMAMEARHAAMMAIHHGEVDVPTHEAKLKEAASHQVMADVAKARKLAEARAVLTQEQRSRLDFAMEAVRALMGMAHGEGGGQGAGGHSHGGGH